MIHAKPSPHPSPSFSYNKYEVGVQIFLTLLIVFFLYPLLHDISLNHAVEVETNRVGVRDCHDFQWEAFRGNIWVMVSLAVGWRLVGAERIPPYWVSS